jgi:hypothetical protein
VINTQQRDHLGWAVVIARSLTSGARARGPLQIQHLQHLMIRITQPQLAAIHGNLLVSVQCSDFSSHVGPRPHSEAARLLDLYCSQTASDAHGLGFPFTTDQRDITASYLGRRYHHFGQGQREGERKGEGQSGEAFERVQSKSDAACPFRLINFPIYDHELRTSRHTCAL